MAISSPGIGSNLPITDIINKLMEAEAEPLKAMATKEASYQAKLSAFGQLKGALAAFQTSLAGLSTPAKFQSFNASVADSTIFSATAGTTALSGLFNINIAKLAQAHSISSAGVKSASATIGSGISTTVSFQFGTISGGTYGTSNATGTALGNAIAIGGIAANSLSINGTNIVTGTGTTSAKALADAINAKTEATKVTATAQTDSGALGSGFVGTTVDGYSLVVGGVTVIPSSTGNIGKGDIDAALAGGTMKADLAAAGITVTGTAAGGDLRFKAADGRNVVVAETLGAGDTGGFFHAAGTTTNTTYTGAISLSSASPISIGGTNPGAAGLTLGTIPNGVFNDASFVQDPGQASGNITVDTSNNSLQGISDAINKANLGVTASIVSDGTAQHLIVTSNKTGEASSMKISVAGDPALENLLAYDPASNDGQKMTQTAAAQSAELTVNGLAVKSATNSVAEAVQGVTLKLDKTGASTLNITRDTGTVSSSVNAFVKAFNDLNSTLKSLTAYTAEPTTRGLLLGDATARQVQSDIRSAMSAVLPGASGQLTSLPQIGITFAKDGSMALDSAKLQKAITNNFSDIGALFATMGKSTDSLVSYVGSTNATKPGNKAINITAIATQGKLTGSTSLAAGATIVAGINDELSFVVDGVSASIKLAAGTYSSTQLTSQIQSAVNGNSALSSAGIAVNVGTDANGFMTVTSNRYGSASIVNASGSGVPNLFGEPVSKPGGDVAGTIDGIDATGSGQVLSGLKGTSTEGLQIKIDGGSLGERGSLNFSQGYAFLLGQKIDSFVSAKGLIAGSTDNLNADIKNLGSNRTAFNKRLEETQKRYLAQFTALDLVISKMNQTSTFLSQQLAQISSLTSQM